MATAELATAAQRAILERVRSQLGRGEPGAIGVIGIRSPTTPTWNGPTTVEIGGRDVHLAACPSLLAVLDALATQPPGSVLVLLTDRPESELGDAVLARLHRGKLLDADRYTLLGDLLAARQLDPRIQTEHWLVDALVELAGADALPPTAGATLSRARVLSLVVAARLGIDPEHVDLPQLVGVLDDAATRGRWRELPADERDGLTHHLVALHGGGAGVLAALAAERDDVIADLLVAQAILVAPVADNAAAVAYGRFTESRFRAGVPSREDLAAAATATLQHVSSAGSARIDQQIRRADAMLAHLHAAQLAIHSPVLPSGYGERLARAAAQLTGESLAQVAEHREMATQRHRHDRLLAALRLRRWLAGEPSTVLDTAAAGVRRHAGELAWVDRALTQVRRGDSDPRIQDVLAAVAKDAGAVRTQLDLAFAARLAAAPETPADLLAVETVLPDLVAPLAREQRVLLVVVDGMSGAVAAEVTDELVDHRRGWHEVVRASDGTRDAVLAALPTETFYSRAGLFAAALRTGTAPAERAAFAAHPFWPPGGAVLVHKAGLAGVDGNDLGAELEDALGPDGPPVVGVVLNGVDDALAHGRQSVDPAWRPEDISGLPQLLERAASFGRVVVLTSDHGHVLEHGSQLRSDPSGGARWRVADAPAGPDEVLVTGPRVLTPEGRAILAATEELRYGRESHGYHGGATLAEVAIPLVVLLPPGTETPAGWTWRAPGGPAWWTGGAAVAPLPPPPLSPSQKRRRKPVAPQAEALFDAPAPQPAPQSAGRGALLVASEAFRAAHAELPANRVPAPEVFAAVVDALDAAGGRLPVAVVLTAAGSAGRNVRGVVAALGRVLNRDSFPVLTLVDGDRAVALDRALLDEQFPASR
ncbi:BREX-2 system phosphatase PglZ [Pseudonocardia nigra]|uniref:BREX-2 system phosphatase PglZ n=1 Tax=Pseudonocardia nigra TaxID=1921578 RepID=UPI001C5FA8B4|nr:BREX-2 system phosphatase PglZ [Pseudonocardia nigra]